MSSPRTAIADSSPRDPFDTEGVRGPVRRVPVGWVVDLLHVSHAPDRVASYAADMRAGRRFPPISVVRLGRRFVIANGHKRFTACRSLGVDTIPVEIWGVARLAADLAGQTRRHLAQAGRALTGPFRGPEGRRETRQFVGATVGHWRRVVVSLLTLGRRP